MQQMQMQYMLHHGNTPALPSAAPPQPQLAISPNTASSVIRSSQSISSSPSKLVVPTVSLDVFGARYGLSIDDIARLETLGYKPGSRHIAKIQEKHWGPEGVKFTVVQH